MNCNCNNINNTDGSGLTTYISHVYGNVLRLAIPLTLRTVTMENGEMVATDTDFIPSSDYPVTVVFSKGGVKISLEATMQNGNIAYIEDLGTIPVGKYDIAILCKDDNGNPYRFKQVTALHIVDATADANIPSDIEYEVTTWYLDAAIFLALKGEDGVGIDDIITESSGEIGGMNTVTIVLTNGETRTFTVMNGSGQVDSDFNINSPHPLSNSTITAKFNAIDSSLEGLFGNVDYDSQSKTIRFYNKDRSRVLATLDARPFIKDGMVNSVYISNNTLVITFNTDAGREAIGVSLSSIFNPNNYYTRTQVNNLLGNYYNKDVIDNLVRNNAALLDDGRLGNLQSSPIVLDGMYWDNDEWPDGVAGDYYKVYHTVSRDKHEIVLYKWINDGTVVRQVRVYRDVDPTAIYYDKDSETFYRYDMVEDDFIEIEIGSGSSGYEPPVGGIPKSDLSQSVQASLSKADTALQSQEQADWNESDSSDPAYIKNKPTIPDVSNLATKSELQSKADASDVYTKTEVDNALALKQGNITDLDQIRAGATLGASSYQKPHSGIPASDLADGVIPDVSGFVTSSDVADAVADLVDSAPATLDTLNELAAALGDDPNFATTMTTALGNKVDKVSGKGLSTEDYTTAEKNKLANLATVATTGSYNDLTDKPVIPEEADLSGYYDKTEVDGLLDDKVDKVSGKGLSTNDYTTAEKTKLAGLSNYDDTALQAAVAGKVDKETGKSLMTDAERTKLAGIASGAEANVQADWEQTTTTADDYIKNKPTLATVATSGSYNDLSNKPTLFSGNYNDLTNKPTIPAAQVNADWNASSGVMEILNKPTIPTKFSDLVDDSDYIKAEDVASIVVGSADVVITETASHINITFVTTSITFSPDTTMSLYAGQKVGTLTVSGTHLKQDITLTVPSNFTAQVSGGTAAQSITIPQTGGDVTGVSVTITYTGADSGSYNGSITATSGSTTASVGLVYSQYQGATIIAGTIGTINAAMGGSQVGELNVSGVNLEGDITASVGSGDFTICATQNGTYGSTATISKSSAEATGGATLYVKYTPSSGTSTASGTLTLSTPKDGSTTTESISLQGAVSTLTLSTNSISISTDQNVAAFGTFTINGSNLTNGVTLVLTDANSVFSLSKNSLTKADAEAGETITVTYNSSNVGNHSGSISVVWDGSTESVTLSGTAAEVPNFNDANSHKLEVGGICYGVIDDGNGGWTSNLAVYNRDFSTSAPTKRYTGEVIIPSTVNAQLDGVPTTFTVTTIKAHAFNSNTGMTKLVIPDTVTSAGNAFLYLASGNLKYLSFGNGLKNSTSETTIPTSSGNSPVVRTGLTYLDLGTGIKRITGMEFRMAVGGTVVLRSDSVVDASPTRLNSNSNNNYAPAIVDGIVKVPSSLVPSYQGATGWSDQNPDSNSRYMVEYDNILAIE